MPEPKMLNEMRKGAKYDAWSKNVLIAEMDAGKSRDEINKMLKRRGREPFDDGSADLIEAWVKDARKIGGEVGQVLEEEVKDSHISTWGKYKERKEELLSDTVVI